MTQLTVSLCYAAISCRCHVFLRVSVQMHVQLLVDLSHALVLYALEVGESH